MKYEQKLSITIILLLLIGVGTAAAKDTLNPGESLRMDQSLKSQNNQYILYMQNDGNLVLYYTKGNSNPSTWTPKWATGTNGQPYKIAVMEYTGDFELLGFTDNAVPKEEFIIGPCCTNWHMSYIQLQNDGNLVMHNAKGEVKAAIFDWISTTYCNFDTHPCHLRNGAPDPYCAKRQLSISSLPTGVNK